MGAGTLTIRVPKQYRDVVAYEDGTFVIEHAALKSRIPETILAALIANPVFGKVVIFAENTRRYAFKLEEWLAKSGVKAQRRVGGYVYGDMTLWIMKPDDQLPDDVSRVIVLDAH